MKNKIVFYVTLFFGAISLQSCVSNYVVSTPITYKSDANLATINTKKIEKLRKELISDNNLPLAAIATIEDSDKAKALVAEINRKNKIDNILEEARTYIGTPYRYGGTTRRGIDCSAFVLSAFEGGGGVGLPRVAAAQATRGDRVDRSEIKKGDLLFFASRGGRGRISHVGIVAEVLPDGGIKFIHASSSQGVTITSLYDSSYWTAKFAYAKRIIDNTDDFTNYN